jgi:hypothetical protein
MFARKTPPLWLKTFLSPAAPTSRLSRLARNQEDCAKRKSPTSTATREPNRLLTVFLPAGGEAAPKKKTHQVMGQHGTPPHNHTLLLLAKHWAAKMPGTAPCMTAAAWALQTLNLYMHTRGSPRRMLHSSRTSSWTRLAVWIISVISANRRWRSVISLQENNRGQDGSRLGMMWFEAKGRGFCWWVAGHTA